MNTVTTNPVAPVVPVAPVTPKPRTKKATESIQGRKPQLVKHLQKFLAKHGPTGEHGMRFHGEKAIAEINTAIQALETLKKSVVIAPVAPIVNGEAVAPVAPVAPVASTPVPVVPTTPSAQS